MYSKGLYVLVLTQESRNAAKLMLKQRDALNRKKRLSASDFDQKKMGFDHSIFIFLALFSDDDDA